MNMDDAMTASEHIDFLSVPVPALDAAADQLLTAVDTVRTFCEVNAFRTQLWWPVNLLSFLPAIRETACGAMVHDYGLVFASDCDLPYGAYIDPGELTGYTHDPRGHDGLPVNVPIAVYRHGNEIHRHFCWGDHSLEIVAEQIRKLPAKHCDVQMLSPAFHASQANVSRDVIRSMIEGDSYVGFGSFGVWPIDRGQFCYFLRYCLPCLGALMAKYEIGKCAVADPWERIG